MTPKNETPTGSTVGERIKSTHKQVNNSNPVCQVRLALRPREAARALGIGERLLWSMTNQGLIPHARCGRAILYPVAELERWLAEQSTGGER